MTFKNDLTGKQFGYWTVLSFDQEQSDLSKRTYWKCKCVCGKEKSILGYNLTSNHSKSCGCQTRNLKKHDLTNQKFGYLTVLEDTGKTTNNRNVIWKCKCKCGNIVEVSGNHLTSNTTTSCGCYSRERSTKDILGKRFGKLTVIEKTDKRKNSYIVWKCKCDCGNICYKDSYCLNNDHTHSCGCLNSKGEALIKNILDDNNICYNQQYTFPDLVSENGNGRLRFDFAIFNQDGSLSHLIEYNGEQHYKCSGQWWNTKENFNNTLKNDKKKIDYCKEKGIKLIIIPYTEYDNLTLERLL